MSDDRVLITGGAGFLGSHLCDRFLEEGYGVIAIDSLLTGTVENVTHLQSRSDFTFIKHDITDGLEIDGELDLILHFASPASPNDYLEMPIQTLKVGAMGTHNALGLARKKDARFVLASTSEIYGDPTVNPQDEEYRGNVDPTGTRGVYDEAKRFAEALTMAYHRYHNLQTHIARIFNTFGPRMRIDDGRALPTFMSQALREVPLTIYGDGSQIRSFCYVDDLVEGVWRLSQSDYNKPLNIGNPDQVTILEFAREILEITGSDSNLEFEKLPRDDPKVRQPDIRRARNILDWEPEHSRWDGLKKTLPYFRNKIGTSDTR